MPPASKTPRVASPRGGSGASAASRSSGSKSARAAPAAGANPLGATLQRQPSKASVQQPQQFQPPPATVQQQKAATASATLGATSTGGGGTMVAAKALVIRTGFELSTPKMADLAAGTTVQVHETRRQPDGSIRARITLSGSTQGWCTSATKDGTLALHELGTSEATAAAEANQRQRRPGSARGPGSARIPGGGDSSSSSSNPAAGGADAGGGGGAGGDGARSARAMATYVISAPKPLLARGEFELQSSRVGELDPGTKVHVLETRPLPDGGKRVRLSLAGQGVPYGWVTAVTKTGQENLQPHLFEVSANKPLLVRSDFDTKVRGCTRSCHA